MQILVAGSGVVVFDGEGRDSRHLAYLKRGFRDSIARLHAGLERHVQGLLEVKDTHRPWVGPMPLGLALP